MRAEKLTKDKIMPYEIGKEFVVNTTDVLSAVKWLERENIKVFANILNRNITINDGMLMVNSNTQKAFEGLK